MTRPSKPDGNLRGNKLVKCLVFALAALGVYLIVYGLAMIVDVLRTENWKTTHGTVIDLQVLEQTDSAEFIVDFNYRVDGQDFSGKWGEGWNHGRGAPGVDNENSQMPSFVSQFRERYAPGNPLEVHFDPANPADYYIDSLENPLVAATVFIVFGVVLVAAFPMTLREHRPRQAADPQKPAVSAPTPAKPHPANVEVANVVEAEGTKPESVSTECIARQCGASAWSPGTLVVFERPAVSNSFLLKSGLIGMAIGSLAAYMWSRNATVPWETNNLVAAVLAMGALGFFLPILFLQGHWPSQKVELDWSSKQLQWTLAGRSKSWPLRDVKSIVHLPDHNAAAVYAVVGRQPVGLFNALDSDFAKLLELPLDQLPLVARELADALGVKVERELHSEEKNASQFWRSIPKATAGFALAVVTTIASLITGWLAPLLAALLIGGLVLTYAGILISAGAIESKSAGPHVAPFSAMVKCWLALAIVTTSSAGLLMSTFPITTVGAALSGILIAAMAFVVFVTPDLVLSQRAGVTIPIFSIARWRLAGFPVQSFVKTVVMFRSRGLRCLVNDVARVYEAERVNDVDSLVAGLEQRQQLGEIQLFPLVQSKNAQAETNRYRCLRTHLGMFAGGLAGIFVIGFFFVMTHGPEHADNLLVARDWQETVGIITKKFPSPGRDHSPSYQFTYGIDGVGYQAICYGPGDLAVGAQESVRFDQSDPAVACLKKGWRADSSPLFPMLFFAFSMLIWLPLPILAGHLLVGLWAAVRGP